MLYVSLLTLDNYNFAILLMPEYLDCELIHVNCLMYANHLIF